MASLNVDILNMQVFERLVILLREIAEETTEPHIREKIINEIRQIHGEIGGGPLQ